MNNKNHIAAIETPDHSPNNVLPFNQQEEVVDKDLEK